MEASILRNAHFGEADMNQQLGRYDEAIEAYRVAAGRYPNQPEALEALAQIAECHRKMGRETEARKTLRQAELVLQRIPSDLDGTFVAHTRGDRQHWQKLLGTLKEWN
jgi:TolA-binding protein